MLGVKLEIAWPLLDLIKRVMGKFHLQIFDLFDVKQKGAIDFGDFVRSLNVFHPNAPLEDKIEFSFKPYDLDGIGFIKWPEEMGMNLPVYDPPDAFNKGAQRHGAHIQTLMHLHHVWFSRVKQMLLALLCQPEMKLADETIEIILDKPKPLLLKIMNLPYLRDITTTFSSFAFRSEVDEMAT
ncbi:unnamed protein product, partial [Thlaspi arvense]